MVTIDLNSIKTDSRILWESMNNTYSRLGWGVDCHEVVDLIWGLKKGQGKRVGVVKGRRAFEMEGTTNELALNLESYQHVPGTEAQMTREQWVKKKVAKMKLE